MKHIIETLMKGSNNKGKGENVPSSKHRNSLKFSIAAKPPSRANEKIVNTKNNK